MRVLIAHNRYRSDTPSGENAVVDNTIEELRRSGVDIVTWMPSSDDVGPDLRATVSALTNPLRPPSSLALWRRRLLDQRPDLLHLHNPYPLIPPAIIDVALAEGIPVLQTLHNGRHVCAKGTFTRDERPCFDCRGRRPPLPAVLHGCYRDSRLQSVIMAGAITVHHQRFRDDVHLLPVSGWLADQLAASGFDRDRMTVVPNGAPDPGPGPAPGSDVVFVGRLDEEKGADALIDAWRSIPRTERRLVIVGDGPLRPSVEAAAAADRSIDYLGRLDRPAVRDVLASAGVVVIPSRVPESFGLVAVEAFAHGRAVVAADSGALRDLVDVDVGWRFGTTAELAEILARFSASDLEVRGRAARARFLARFSIERTTQLLQDVYRDTLGHG